MTTAEIRDLLKACCRDVRRMSRARFHIWLEHRLDHWQRDPVFVQRSLIRDLRRAHSRLAELEQECLRAQELDRDSPQFDRLARVQKQIFRADKAIAGLSLVAGRAEKLAGFVARRESLLEEEAALVGSSPQRRRFLALSIELRQFRESIGLPRQEARLGELLREMGRRAGRRGGQFEEGTLAALRQLFEGADFLNGVTLGAVDTEFDWLVLHEGAVLAVVEAKRNINDLARGQRVRATNLSWLRGSFDEEYRNRNFPAGVFTEAFHDGHRLTPQSFAHTELFLVSRRSPIWGLSSAALGRLSYRLSVDEEVNPDRLRRWCQKLASDWETPDLLRWFARSDERARRLLLI